MKPKYSVLIPSYDPDGQKIDMVCELIRSIEENSKGKDFELIMRKNGPSYTESHNDALQTARGDYLIILNDDVVIKDPEWIDKFCKDRVITGWRVGVFHLLGGVTAEVPMPDASGWAMSREIFERVGLLDEDYKDGISYEDTDYFLRAHRMGIRFVDAKIEMTHIGGHTMRTYLRHIDRDHNRKIFESKWKGL